MSETIYTFDRSTLELWATCPRQARLRSQHTTTVGEIAVVGQEVHEAISRTIQYWTDSQGLVGLTELVERLHRELWNTRADVQPEVIAAMRKSVWSFGRFLTDEHFLNIMRFDGGEGEKSGQLSHDFDGLNCRVTAELDLLMATPSKREVDIYDWKSGWRHWTASQVKRSFQFQMQSWLVLENYPDVECVRCTIWNLRENRRTYSVEFTRADSEAIEARIRNAAGLAVYYGAQSNAKAPAWPTTEKCELCPVAIHCDAADDTMIAVAEEPELWVDRLVALTQQVASTEKALTQVAVARGTDIETSSGNCFGFGKPKRTTKPKAAAYARTAVTTEESE